MDSDKNSFGQPYTAAFTQPITSPGGADMNQQLGPQQMAQPMQMGAQMSGQPMQMGQPMSMNQPMQMGQPMGQPNVEQNPVTGAPIISQSPIPESMPRRKDIKSLIKTIAIIALSLVSLTFIGLFIWMFVQYDAARTNVDGQIAVAVAEERDELTVKLENEFAEREKYPFRTFAGPADYGALTFEYPKTWSVYIPKDASKGGDFEAYFNPIEVNEINNQNIQALRVSILDTPFDDVVARYQGELEGDEPRMRLESVTIGEDNAVPANKYTGIIPGTEFNGYVVIFKIRDKTAILQTDSVLFEADYNTLLSTVRFNA